MKYALFFVGSILSVIIGLFLFAEITSEYEEEECKRPKQEDFNSSDLREKSSLYHRRGHRKNA